VSTVRIELYGVPRLRAGLGEVVVEATTLAEALAALGRACPALRPAVVDGERLQPSYLVALNGRQFAADPGTHLRHGDVLVIVAAQAGG
jgi:molybdopterin converting factor small subunit